ncbi:amino acid synthesis family protein [Paraburkholderia bengalensis]|uniref:Amino acid synthesis family protein n=1 Tax=Paraburkholderia bengalensis TaxID=2747562 RepID=A0ABU8J3F9_9BURK
MSDAANRIVRQIFIFERNIVSEGDYAVRNPAKHVVAAAVLRNPFAGQRATTEEELGQLADLSFDVGSELATRALARFENRLRPSTYGKAVIIGQAGNSEHGAAMIHPRLGLAMRNALGAGPALIPGVAKTAGVGASIDLAFGDVNDSWEYDSMDAIEVAVPGAPAADEMVLFVGFGTARANARVRGATAEQVANVLAASKSR